MKGILFFILLILGYNVFGQVHSVDDNSIIIIRDDNAIIVSDEPGTSATMYKPIKDALKFDLAGMVYGKYGVYYEREIAPVFSVEAGVGITFFDVSELIFGQLPDKSFVVNANFLSLSDYRWINIFKSKPGYFLQLSPKFYLKNNGFDGLYLGVGGFYSQWNYKERFDEESYFAGSSQNRIGGSLLFGYQRFGAKTCLDITVGIIGYKNKAKALLEDGGEFEFSYGSFSNVFALKLGPVFRKKIKQ